MKSLVRRQKPPAGKVQKHRYKLPVYEAIGDRERPVQ
jgi:hypothetical protein